MRTSHNSTVFTGMVFDIEQLEVEIGSRGSHTFQIIRHPGGAGVLPVHEDGTVSLIRQLRPAVGCQLLEIPAGRLDPGEPPVECAGRELQEETGLSAKELIPLGTVFSSPGVFDEVIHLFAGARHHPGRSPARGGRGDRGAAPAAGRGAADGRRRAHQRRQDPGGPFPLGPAEPLRECVPCLISP